VAPAHQAVLVELPVLVAVGAEPGAGVVVGLVGEADGDAVAVVGPQFLDQWIVDRAVEAGLVVEPPPVPSTGQEWSGPIQGSYRSFLGGLARFLPGSRPYLRPVRTTISEALDRSVLRRWTDGTPPYRPRNPYLEPWIREEL
jgi:hypothetical protein